VDTIPIVGGWNDHGGDLDRKFDGGNTGVLAWDADADGGYG
jgi:hypothetical protein